MRSEQRGASTSAVEVGNVTRQGFWLLLDGRELFLPFADFPWFRTASIEDLTTIERPSGDATAESTAAGASAPPSDNANFDAFSSLIATVFLKPPWDSISAR